MIKVVVGGQMEKQSIKQQVMKSAGDKATVKIKNDIDAAMDVKRKEADLYLGACHTGGGAIAMATAINGHGVCATVSTPGKPPTLELIEQHINDGIKVFGFTSDHIKTVVPMIIDVFIEKSTLNKKL